MNKYGAAWMISGLALGGCAVLTPRDEFTAYRLYRYESSPEQRPVRAMAYLDHYPNGRFAAQVRSETVGREEQYWDEHRASLEGLRAYVEAYPSGAHAAEARARIDAYESERRRNVAEQQAREQAEQARRDAEMRERMARERFFVRNNVLSWLRSLGGLEGWGRSIPEVAQQNPEFSTAFGAEPAPRCRAGRCRKTWPLDFVVPIPGGTAVPRRLVMSLDLLRTQALTQAGLVLHRRGLGTWYELETRTPLREDDAEARGRAVQWAMVQLKGIVAVAFPDARETPATLVGPEPEMEGEVAEDDPATSSGAGSGRGGPTAQTSARPTIPPQPLGVQWSYVVGCPDQSGAVITAPPESRPEGWTDATAAQSTVRGCLRIDAYSAPDIEGVSTDEGLRLSWISPEALAIPAARTGGRAAPRQGPSAPVRPGPGNGPRPGSR